MFTQAEVRATTGEEWQGWMDALMEELDSIRSAGVYRKTSKEQAALLGNMFEVIPSKIVWAKKPNTPEEPHAARKKTRIVCCGNFQRKKQEEVYTSLMDATTLRLVIRMAASRRWSLGKLDIKTAFLNAPLENEAVIVRPPPLAVLLGLAETDELWMLLRALYGLRVAPKAWEEERDRVLK